MSWKMLAYFTRLLRINPRMVISMLPREARESMIDYFMDVNLRGDDYEKYIPSVRSYADITKMFEGGYHTLMVGVTNSGKSTLLSVLLSDFVVRGFTVLARDDGGLDLCNIMPEVPITLWIPDGCKLVVYSCPYRYRVVRFDWTRPREILDHLEPNEINLVVFDGYCSEPWLSAMFWSDLFWNLISKCMKLPRSKKRKIIFSIDELNDLIQPRGYELTPMHSKVRSLMEYNVRKLRKHRVTLIATTHRFVQLSLNARSQFAYTILKRTPGYDAWDFVSKSLATMSNKTFWAVLKDITSMGPESFYLFDWKNNFDRYVFSDIPRPEIDMELIGEIRAPEKERAQPEWKHRLAVLVKHVVEKGWMSRAEIARMWGVDDKVVRRLVKSPLAKSPRLAHLVPPEDETEGREVMGKNGEEEIREKEEG